MAVERRILVGAERKERERRRRRVSGERRMMVRRERKGDEEEEDFSLSLFQAFAILRKRERVSQIFPDSFQFSVRLPNRLK